MFVVWLLFIFFVEGFAVARKSKDVTAPPKAAPSQSPSRYRRCGSWERTVDGGYFNSPNYPDKYPPNKECLYVLEAQPRQRIELQFNKTFYIEGSFECRFDNLEVRDGPFSFSPLISRFCGSANPGLVLSSGRFMWIRFYSDDELEGVGFHVQYTFTEDPDFHLHVGGLLNPIPDCQFNLSGADGMIRSSQVEDDNKVKTDQAVDCIWTIHAPKNHRIYLHFLEYQMENSNECKRNFVAIYDGSNAIEDLKAKFCSTVANDVMLETGVGVVRMWADEGSRLSRFRMLFTSFVEPPCLANSFFCDNNMCINNSLVCNGIQNCVFPWDENNCKEKKSKGLLFHLTKTHGSIIFVSTGVVLLLFVVSLFLQVKQPRKKVLVRKNTFQKGEFQEAFDPPHYELFSLRDKDGTADIGVLSEELQSLQALRRSSVSSRCIHEHHCGSQVSINSLKPIQVPLVLGRGSLDLPPFRGELQAPLPPLRDGGSGLRKKSWPNVQQPTRVQSHHSLSRQERVMEEEEEEEEDGRYDMYVRRGGSRRAKVEMAQQRSLSMDF
ncbi:unnamed protein product [Knipowitschia caucasica]|uniref:CUB domain-containing protein n=1 Tax=Knipowitschia caucasica TaxID=637954 RepID=A0AAV2KQC3_KNICA